LFLKSEKLLSICDLSSKLTWKRSDLHVFTAVVGRKTSSPDSFEDAVLLDPPFWGHLNIDLYFSFYFKAQISNLSVLGMKTRPWKFLDLDRDASWLPALFERAILRRKTIFLGPLKSSKNMFRKPILIGLFVLKNNRTIGEQKVFREGRKGNCPHMLFFGRLRAAQGNGGVFHTGGYGRHRRQWVKPSLKNLWTSLRLPF